MPTNDKNYEKIFSENVKILESSNPVEIKQTNPLFESEERELSNRGDLYTALLNAYVTDFDLRHKSNRIYKKVFFVIIMIIFCLSTFGSTAILIFIAIKGKGNSNEFALILSSLATILSSLIILPQIIAKYLFPLDEDNRVTEMVKTMQENDSVTRKIHNGMNGE